MIRNLLLMFVAAGVLLTAADVSAMRKTDFQGKVTSIKGNVIKFTTAKGEKITAEVHSIEGIKIGDRAWCEEDCGKGMRIGNKVVNIKTLK